MFRVYCGYCICSSWAAKNGEEELNKELQKLYGLDLDEFEAFAKKTALEGDDGRLRSLLKIYRQIHCSFRRIWLDKWERAENYRGSTRDTTRDCQALLTGKY